eukprot:5310814-Alexandrium_andersonii.AAC.1
METATFIPRAPESAGSGEATAAAAVAPATDGRSAGICRGPLEAMVKCLRRRPRPGHGRVRGAYPA